MHRVSRDHCRRRTVSLKSVMTAPVTMLKTADPKDLAFLWRGLRRVDFRRHAARRHGRERRPRAIHPPYGPRWCTASSSEKTVAPHIGGSRSALSVLQTGRRRVQYRHSRGDGREVPSAEMMMNSRSRPATVTLNFQLAAENAFADPGVAGLIAARRGAYRLLATPAARTATCTDLSADGESFGFRQRSRRQRGECPSERCGRAVKDRLKARFFRPATVPSARPSSAHRQLTSASARWSWFGRSWFR
jgi:hypothetical protein